MSSSNPDNKKQIITAALILVSLLVYLFTGHIGMFTSAAVVISSAVFAITLLSKSKAFRTATSAVHIIITAAVGIYLYKDVPEMLFFTASVAAVGAIISSGIRKKKNLNDTLIPAIIALVVFALASVIYEVWRTGTPVSVNSVIDHFIAPTVNMVNEYSAIAAQNGIPLDPTIVLGLVKNMAIGSFCASAILEVFIAYIACAALNRWLAFSDTSLLDPVKALRVSRVGSILFVIAAIVDLWSQTGHLKLIATNFYTMMQFPFNLCGIVTINHLMTRYSLKVKTKKLITIILVVFSLLPVINLSSALAFIGALYNFAAPSMPQSPDKNDKGNV